MITAVFSQKELFQYTLILDSQKVDFWVNDYNKQQNLWAYEDAHSCAQPKNIYINFQNELKYIQGWHGY